MLRSVLKPLLSDCLHAYIKSFFYCTRALWFSGTFNLEVVSFPCSVKTCSGLDQKTNWIYAIGRSGSTRCGKKQDGASSMLKALCACALPWIYFDRLMSCSFVLNLNCCNTLFRSKTWRLPPCADLKIQKMVISSDLLYTELPTCTKPLLRRLIWMYSCIVVRKVGEEIQCHLKHLSAHGPNSPWPSVAAMFRWIIGSFVGLQVINVMFISSPPPMGKRLWWMRI